MRRRVTMKKSPTVRWAKIVSNRWPSEGDRRFITKAITHYLSRKNGIALLVTSVLATHGAWCTCRDIAYNHLEELRVDIFNSFGSRFTILWVQILSFFYLLCSFCVVRQLENPIQRLQRSEWTVSIRNCFSTKRAKVRGGYRYSKLVLIDRNKYWSLNYQYTICSL